MGIMVAWDNDEKTIIRYTYSSRWTWNELYAALDEQAALQATVSHDVAILIDVRNVHLVPEGFISHVKRVGERVPKNTSARVVVSNSPFLKSLFLLASKLFPHITHDIQFVATIEEAYALLPEHERIPDGL